MWKCSDGAKPYGYGFTISVAYERWMRLFKADRKETNGLPVKTP